jgi:triosephosphate isomerase
MKPHPFLFGTSWKMNKTVRETTDYVGQLLEKLPSIPGIEQAQVFVIPPFTAIESAKRVSDGRIWIGAQNMHEAEWGAYTGEISAPMLKELGVEVVELGHSERRRLFNDTDAAINLKIRTALRFGIRPVVCVGDLLEERRDRVHKEAVARQIKIDFKEIAPELASRLIIAYEPVWAIGEGAEAATTEVVRDMQVHIRSVLAEVFGPQTASDVAVIYGGSVNVENASDILTKSGLDGLFVGRGALKVENFVNLIRACLTAVLPKH